MNKYSSLDLEIMLRATKISDSELEKWPTNRVRTIGLRDDLLARFAEIRNGPLKHDEMGQSIVDVIRFHWIRMVLSLAYNQKLADRFVEMGCVLDCQERYPTLSAIMSDRQLPDDQFLPALRLGPPRYPIWRWPLRLAKRAMNRSTVRAFPWPKPGRAGEVVTVVQGRSIDQLAEQRGTRPRYCEFDVWFRSSDARASNRHRSFAGLFVEAAKQAARTYGIALRPALTDWLCRQFELSAAGVEAHQHRLRKSSAVPQELWIGSSSSFWPRLLAKEVLRRRGRVVAFDHGFGSGYFDGVDVPFSIQPFCTEFVTEGGLQAEQIQRFFSHRTLPGTAEIKVMALENSQASTESARPLPERRHGNNRKRGASVMLLPLPMMGELFNLTPYPDDVWVQDLNRRLISDLVSMDCRVLVKPHPEFDNRELAALVSNYGAEMVEGRFEAVTHLADSFLFTHPLTSTLQTAIDNGLRSAVIDFGFIPWRTLMKAELEKHVTLLPGKVGLDNRLVYDVKALRRALQLCQRSVRRTDGPAGQLDAIPGGPTAAIG